MRVAVLIALRDLRSRLRDRSVLISAVVAPLALAAILTSALGGTASFTTSYGLVVADDGQLGAAFARAVTGPDVTDFADVTSYDDVATAEQAVRDEEIAAAWVVPAGFSRTVTTGGQATVEVIGTPDGVTAAGIAESIATGFAADVQARSLAAQLGAAPSGDEPLPSAVELSSAEPEEVTDVAASYFGPAMATFFVFFLVALGPRSLMDERRQGTLDRLLAAPIRPGSVLAGKALGVFVIALGSLMVLWLATTLLLGSDWGSPVGVVAISAAFVLAAAAISAFVSTLARSEKQVDGINSIVVFTFALLGGNFVQLQEMPQAIRTLSRATPNGWALEGYTELIAGGAVTDVLVDVGVLLAIAAVFALLALPGIRRTVGAAA